MSVSLSRIVGLAVAVLILGADATASARPKRHPAAQRPPAQVTTNCDGTPIIMQGMPCRQLPARATEQTGEQPPKGVERRRLTTRGSGGPYVPSVQRTPSVGLSQPSGSVYTPPAIANPSERIKDLNSSFPLNGGLGSIPAIATTTSATISTGNGRCRFGRALRPRLLMAPARHSATTGSGLPPGRLPALGRVLMKSRLVTAPWINVRFGPLCN